MLRKIIVLIFGLILGIYLNSSSSKLAGLDVFMRPPLVTTSICSGKHIGFPFTYTCRATSFWYVPGERTFGNIPAILNLVICSFVPYLIIESWIASQKKKN